MLQLDDQLLVGQQEFTFKKQMKRVHIRLVRLKTRLHRQDYVILLDLLPEIIH